MVKFGQVTITTRSIDAMQVANETGRTKVPPGKGPMSYEQKDSAVVQEQDFQQSLDSSQSAA